MKHAFLWLFLLSAFPAVEMSAQESAGRGLHSPTPAPRSAVGKAGSKDPLKSAFGGNLAASNGQPITTEIYSDEAFFDSQKSIGTFSGHVVVNDPRFNIQADKLTVLLAKGEEQGLEKAIAEGNVGMVRERPGENGGPPERAVGRAERAVYTTKDGNVELTGSPRVQSGLNTHIATSPETVMVLNQSGQLTTRGPSRTEIRQEPKASPTPKP